MAKKKGWEPASEPDQQINMTPMIDCVFQLLIFFMIIADMANVASDREISLPFADKTIKYEGKDPIIVNVRRRGEILVNNDVVNENQLIQRLQAAANTMKGADGISEMELFIRGDEFGEWQGVQKVMWHAQDAAIYKIKLGSSGDANKIK